MCFSDSSVAPWGSRYFTDFHPSSAFFSGLDCRESGHGADTTDGEKLVREREERLDSGVSDSPTHEATDWPRDGGVVKPRWHRGGARASMKYTKRVLLCPGEAHDSLHEDGPRRGRIERPADVRGRVDPEDDPVGFQLRLVRLRTRRVRVRYRQARTRGQC